MEPHTPPPPRKKKAMVNMELGKSIKVNSDPLKMETCFNMNIPPQKMCVFVNPKIRMAGFYCCSDFFKGLQAPQRSSLHVVVFCLRKSTLEFPIKDRLEK